MKALLIIQTIVLLISIIVLFVVERRKYTFDKTKAKVIILASSDRLEIEKRDADIIKKYNVLDTASGDLKKQHETIYIKSYLAEKR
ncbi:hypothetical protein [Enterococcus cecorum]|uniref:hypothetical protein n=1 Tax=Enterococcus cecorum TaxID=44008 RepID=UPI002ACA45DD|nr:hypothetical protein [Enterococcus cecorum]MDZ5584756.1 hypothetical protein [Enterococcus cecorum]